MSRTRESRELSDEARWGLGCLVAGVSIVGVAILVVGVALVVQPPAWLQVVLGVLLVVGGVLLGWLVSSALRRAEPSGPHAVPEPEASPKRVDSSLD